MPWVSLCELSELRENEPRYAEVDGFQLAVILHGGEVHVMDNHCPHAGGNLAGGYVEEGCAVCPWHHWAFDLKSGELQGYPGITIATYPARILNREAAEPLVQAELPMF